MFTHGRDFAVIMPFPHHPAGSAGHTRPLSIQPRRIEQGCPLRIELRKQLTALKSPSVTVSRPQLVNDEAHALHHGYAYLERERVDH